MTPSIHAVIRMDAGAAGTGAPRLTITTTTTLPAFSEPIELSGRGDDGDDIEIPDDAAAIVPFTHQGSSNFAVWSHHRTGGRDLG